MEEHIAAPYKDASRFDEGELLSDEAYKKAMERQHRLYELMVATFGRKITIFLEEYTVALYDEMECEARHYFQEGYRAAKKGT